MVRLQAWSTSELRSSSSVLRRAEPFGGATRGCVRPWSTDVSVSCPGVGLPDRRAMHWRDARRRSVRQRQGRQATIRPRLHRVFACLRVDRAVWAPMAGWCCARGARCARPGSAGGNHERADLRGIPGVALRREHGERRVHAWADNEASSPGGGCIGGPGCATACELETPDMAARGRAAWRRACM